MNKTELGIDIMQDASQKVYYDLPEIPYYFRTGNLSFYPQMEALPHWHDDFEIIRLLYGTMNYEVNGQKLRLQERDTLLINSSQLHHSFSDHGKDCKFYCFVFSPELVCPNPGLFSKYVKPILSNNALPYFLFHEIDSTNTSLIQIIDRLAQISITQPRNYDFVIASLLNQFWLTLLNKKNLHQLPLKSSVDADLCLQKEMTNYIHLHYQETILLRDIARAANISITKCCRIFKRYMRYSPIEYTNIFRLKSAAHRLLNTSDAITTIALDCGFIHPSYFAEQFKKYYHYSPRAYRKHFLPSD